MSNDRNDPELQETDVNSINSLPDEPFEQFIQLVYQFLINPKQSETLLLDLSKFCEETCLGVGAVKNLLKCLLLYLRGGARKGFTAQLLQQHLLTFGVDETKARVLSQLWKTNYSKICRSMLSQVFHINRLLDIEWKFGVTAATSESEEWVGQSFIQMKLVLDGGGGTDSVENVHMELSLPQFYAFMHEMEKAKAGLEMLS